MNIITGIIKLNKILKHVVIGIIICICYTLLNTYRVLSGNYEVCKTSVAINLSPFCKLFILISFILSLVLIRVSKNITISLDIFFLLNILILPLYQFFKDPEPENQF